MLLRACYAQPGACCYLPTHTVCHVRYGPSTPGAILVLSAYARSTPSPVLTHGTIPQGLGAQVWYQRPGPPTDLH
eukprot:1573772-Rhodomonas_salina.1